MRRGRVVGEAGRHDHDRDQPCFAVRGLVRSYPGRGGRRPTDAVVATDDVDLDIPTGQVFGLLGPNGAGKTSLVRQLIGLLRPDSGTVALFGTTSRAGPTRSRGRSPTSRRPSLRSTSCRSASPSRRPGDCEGCLEHRPPSDRAAGRRARPRRAPRPPAGQALRRSTQACGCRDRPGR